VGNRVHGYAEIYQAVRSDIFKFCQLLHFVPTPQQCALFKEVQAGKQFIAVKSGQGTGKSASSGVIGLWRAFRNPMSRTVVTAPTMRQCKTIWLTELRKTLAAAEPILQKLVEITRTEVKIAGNGASDWGCELVTATSPINAQGYHNDHLTFIVEEASGVERPFIEQIEGTLTQKSGDKLLLQIGNPNRTACALYDAFTRFRHRWSTLTFDSRKSPLTSPETIDYLREKYGEDSNVFRIRVKGQFPTADPECIVSVEDLETCAANDMVQLSMIRGSEGQIVRRFALDFARFGGDENVVMRRVGNAIVQWGFWPMTDPSVVIGKAFKWQSDVDWRDDECTYVGDAGGMGQGLMHLFYDAGKQVVEFHNGGSASRPEYANLITEAWFHFAELARAGLAYIPNDNRLIQQLCTRKYKISNENRSVGKLIVESKDEYKKRMVEEGVDDGGSPDRADACVMAFYDSAPTGRIEYDDHGGRVVGIKVRR